MSADLQIAVRGEECEGEIHLQGAHIAKWVPRGQKPGLFLSSKSAFAPGKAIRGGVPIVFPWFGARSDGQPGPQHGFARTSLWEFNAGPDLFAFSLNAAPFRLYYGVRMGASLEMSLEAGNAGSSEVHFEEALHTYLAVGDVRQVSITGLEGAEYIDKTDGFRRKLRGAGPLRLTGPTDAVHLNTGATCVIDDPVWNRRIVVEKTGSRSTVVWNPWSGLSDLPENEWPGFVCVETANAADNAVTLKPGETHQMTATIKLA